MKPNSVIMHKDIQNLWYREKRTPNIIKISSKLEGTETLS
jgi:hypothetical protein